MPVIVGLSELRALLLVRVQGEAAPLSGETLVGALSALCNEAAAKKSVERKRVEIDPNKEEAAH